MLLLGIIGRKQASKHPTVLSSGTAVQAAAAAAVLHHHTLLGRAERQRQTNKGLLELQTNMFVVQSIAIPNGCKCAAS
jgi:hypothetical protein